MPGDPGELTDLREERNPPKLTGAASTVLLLLELRKEEGVLTGLIAGEAEGEGSLNRAARAANGSEEEEEEAEIDAEAGEEVGGVEAEVLPRWLSCQLEVGTSPDVRDLKKPSTIVGCRCRWDFLAAAPGICSELEEEEDGEEGSPGPSIPLELFRGTARTADSGAFSEPCF